MSRLPRSLPATTLRHAIHTPAAAPTPAFRCTSTRTLRSKPVRGPRTTRHRDPVLPSSTSSSSHFRHPQPVQSTEDVDMGHKEAVNVPVIVPHDPSGLVQPDSIAAPILKQSGLMVVRQLEMLNVCSSHLTCVVGFEQANKYAIMDPAGQTVGYIAEEEAGIVSALSRQALRTHRPFKCTVMDASGQVMFRIHRPFAFINSRITISLGDDPSNVVGECQQEWHPWKRRYNLFLNRNGDFEQFARVDAGLLSWTFDAMDQDGRVLASIDRNWAGFGRELFTDTGHYALKFDAVGLEAADRSTSEEQDSSNSNTRDIVVHQGITLDQRAVLLATAVTCDIDYFSRHSGHGGGFGFMPFFPVPFGGAGEPAPGPAPDSEGDVSPTGSSPLSSQSDEPLPRSQEADRAAESRGWDSFEDDVAARQGDEVMQDPWSDNQGPSMPTWGDLFDSDEE